MKVMFLVGALYTSGEMRVALNFAQTLGEYGDEVFFASFSLGAEIVRERGFPHLVLGSNKEENMSRFSGWLRRVSPDVIVLADYYLFMTDDVQALFEFNDLASLEIPILTLDNVGLSPDEQVLPWLSIGKTCTVGPTPDFIQAIIRPCPPHDPSVARERTVYARVYEEPLNLSPAERKMARKEIGCGDRDKHIFYVVPGWVYWLAGQVPWLYAYYMFLPEIFERYFEGLDQRVHFTFISPRRLLQSANGGVRAHWLKSRSGQKLLSEKQFNAMVLASDLFITDSILSCTLGLALFGLVPSISLMNTVTVEDLSSGPGITSPFPLTAWARENVLHRHRVAPGSVFPFAWFPFGLLEEIERLHDGSAYLRAVKRCELFDQVGTTAVVRDLLFDEAQQSQVNTLQREYVETVVELPGFPGLLRQVTGG